MRRTLAILFALVLGLGPVWASVPANALASGLRNGWTGKVEESHLPACCRRNGVHHCSMGAQVADGETSVSSSACCPCLPGTLATASTPFAAITGESNSLQFANDRWSGRARIFSADFPEPHTWPKRGPPSLHIL
jgi:hypothetical protein